MTDVCHWTGERRALGERHDGPHDDCPPCTRRHCGDCGSRHVDETDRTCPRCIGRSRTCLAEIGAYYAQLDEEATHHPNDAIPGGMATVLVGPGSLGESQQWAETQGWDCSHKGDEYRSDPMPTLLALATWEDAWRDILRDADPDIGPGPERATVESAIEWLTENLHLLAQHDAWPQFVEDIRQARARLEVTLSAGDRPFQGVRCLSLDCDGTLLAYYQDAKPCEHDTEARRRVRWMVGQNARARAAKVPVPHGTGRVRAALRVARQPCEQCDQGGRRDEWRCSKCRRRYDDETYRRAVRQDVVEHDPLRTAHELARDLGVAPGRVRIWVHRKALEVVGHRRGRKLYDIREARRLAMRGEVA
jgi:hypothetical protein